MAEMGRVVVLTHRHLLHYCLIGRLAEHFSLSLVIYERQSLGKSVRLFARRARRLGWGAVGGQFVYFLWDRLYVQPRSRAQISRILAACGADAPGPEIPQMDVNSVNDDIVAETLEALRPDVCVVAGTSIIRSHILEKAPVFLNVHAGITPGYRGAHGAFWAIYEGRPELAGVTVHVVDSGIDTGGIVAQAPIVVEPQDTPRTLVAKQYVAAMPLLVAAVRQALDHALTTSSRDDLDSRLWYSPTPADYWRFRKQLSRLPK